MIAQCVAMILSAQICKFILDLQAAMDESKGLGGNDDAPRVGWMQRPLRVSRSSTSFDDALQGELWQTAAASAYNS